MNFKITKKISFDVEEGLETIVDSLRLLGLQS
jgi:hypothetical protein